MLVFVNSTNSFSHRRSTAITASVLKEYKELISNTTADLEDHLQIIDERLKSISVQGTGISDEDAVELQQLQEERNSTQQCLEICTKVLKQIDQAQPNAFINLSSTYHPTITTLSGLQSAQQLTSVAFTACKERLTETTTRLENQLRDINHRLERFSLQTTKIKSEQAAEEERMQEEKAAVKQSLDICAEASKQANQERTNVYEDISLVDDSQQVIISTVGDLIAARRVTGGSRSLMVFGQMSDESFQHLTRRIGTEALVESQSSVGPEFSARYGTGIKLSGQI
jgi:hypothetical protein